jgi:hypothetical protein
MVYPRFILDKPDGKDLYQGQSQKSLSENIQQFIIENDDNNKKVIGIEGEWGSGKSNVIEMLKKDMKESYHFFVFDAWGYQEDLTRRSILEGLLRRLISDEVLNGTNQYWENELKTLLAKKVEKEQRNIPQLSTALILTVMGILFMPITKTLAENYLKSYAKTDSTPGPTNYLIAGLILICSFLPVIIWLLTSIYKAKPEQRRKIVSDALYIYKGKEIINTSEEKISENEPTISQFTAFLKNLEDKSKKKLVIVFDNMDRLPSNKVKEIWSSIHTFFATADNGLKTWAIVPFDNDHICNIFNDENQKENVKDEDIARADSYIHKTFSIVFHVPPPIASDWKDFFDSKFKDAFNIPPPPDQNLETIFDYHHLNKPKIKPRDIICFINDLVALKKLRKDEIDLKYLALFSLKRTEIMSNPFEVILSQKYLRSLNVLFEHDDNLVTNISALAFNVPTTIADEILFKRTIEKALKGEGDLSKVSAHKVFFNVFDSAFYNTTPNIIHTIFCLENLPSELKENSKMINYWNVLSDFILKVDRFDKKYIIPIKTLTRRLKDHKVIERLLRFLFLEVTKERAGEEKLYSGQQYYELITDIESLLQEVWPEKQVDDLLTYNVVKPKEFFDFINACPKTYEKYKVSCDGELNNYLISEFNSNNISPYLKSLTTLNGKLDLSVFTIHIQNIIPTLIPSLANYQEILTNTFDVGKALSSNRKLVFDIPETISAMILTAAPEHNRKIDLVLSIIKSNIITPQSDHLTKPSNSAFKKLTEATDVGSFVEDYKYYFNYQDLIAYYLQFPTPFCKQAIVAVTNGNNDIEILNLEVLIHNYIDIKGLIFDANLGLCHSFITKLDKASSKSNIIVVSEQSLTPVANLINDNHLIENDLVKSIIEQANNFIITLDPDNWLQTFKNWETSKNIALFKVLVETKKYNSDKLPVNAYGAYSEVIKLISKKEIPIPTNISIWNTLLDYLTGNFINTYKDVRDELLNHNHGDVSFEELQFFEKGLFRYGKLEEDSNVADDTLRRVLIPLANSNEMYIQILKNNAEKIKSIVELAKDSIIDFKNALDTKCSAAFADSEIRSFGDLLASKATMMLAELNREPEKTDS